MTTEKKKQSLKVFVFELRWGRMTSHAVVVAKDKTHALKLLEIDENEGFEPEAQAGTSRACVVFETARHQP